MELYTRHEKALLRYIVLRGLRPQYARELAQETFQCLLEVKHIERILSPQAYLFRIALNLVRHMRNREARSPVVFSSVLVEIAADEVCDPLQPDPVVRVEMQQQLMAAFRRLPPLQASILFLQKNDGLSSLEIARRLKISIHTVKKYLCRAKQTCRRMRRTSPLALLCALVLIGADCPPERPWTRYERDERPVSIATALLAFQGK